MKIRVMKIGSENLSFGELGIDTPANGLLNEDPKLYENIEGFFQPQADSPIIESASAGYPEVPLYPQMDYDNDILLDLMKQTRPMLIEDRTVGATEFSTTINVVPHVTEMSTGSSYLFDSLVDYIATNLSQLYVGD